MPHRSKDWKTLERFSLRVTIHLLKDLCSSSYFVRDNLPCFNFAGTNKDVLCSPQLRPISTGKLSALQHVHFPPINVVIYNGSITIPHLGVGLALEMLSALIPSRYSYSAMPVVRQQIHQGSVPLGPLVLERAPLKNLTLTQDRDRTVLRRSEPSSRTLLTGEQPDPWDLLQPQDRMSRHRGAKPPRRYGLSEAISLLSPE